MIKIAATVLLSLALLGCGTGLMQQFVDAPEVKGVSLKSFSAKKKTAVFELDLYNPNAFALSISGLSGDIELNQLPIGSIEIDSEQSIAGHETQKILLPIKLDAKAFIDSAKSVLKQGQAEYSLKGDVDTAVGLIPFSTKGDLSLQDIVFSLFR